MSAVSHTRLARVDVEDFLFHEAALLDDWQLDAWLALFTPECLYAVVSPDLPVNASPTEKLFLIADDHVRLAQRVIRLKKKTAHAEFPKSKTLHQVSNVQLLGQEAGVLHTRSALSVFRTKDSVTTHFIGHAWHTLVTTTEGLRIRDKRCTFALDTLRAQGKLSIIL